MCAVVAALWGSCQCPWCSDTTNTCPCSCSKWSQGVSAATTGEHRGESCCGQCGLQEAVRTKPFITFDFAPGTVPYHWTISAEKQIRLDLLQSSVSKRSWFPPCIYLHKLDKIMPVVASQFSFQCLLVLPLTSCLPVLGNFRLSLAFLSILYFHLFLYVTITKCHSQVTIMLASVLRCTGFKCWLFWLSFFFSFCQFSQMLGSYLTSGNDHFLSDSM